jgi:hypothetical protein
MTAPLLLAAALGGLGLRPAQAVTTGCQSWTGTQPASPGTNTRLNGVTVLSACNAWTVGSFTDASGVQESLIEHWDGSNWTVVPSPDPGSGTNDLAGVRAAAPSNIWAVGSDSDAGLPSKTLIVHWDGHHWTQQDSPSPGESTVLSGVRAVSGSEAWAVGSAQGGSSAPLALHFTGGRWRQAKLPSLGSAELLGVAASSARDVWAVGTATGTSQEFQTLILHWNGKTWTRVPSPSLGTASTLNAVGASSPDSALAVGQEETTGGILTVALSWNGKTWTQVPSPSPGGAAAEDFLTGVYLTSPTSGWAVGGGESASGRPLIQRWNGSRLTTVAAPDPGAISALFAIGASSASSAWAVGIIVGRTDQAFALRCC